MKDIIKDFLNKYAEDFEYTASIDEATGIGRIITQYGSIGLQETGDEVKMLKVEPLDEDNDDQISSLIKIKKNFVSSMKKYIEENRDVEKPAEKPAEEKPKRGRPAKPKETEEDPESIRPHFDASGKVIDDKKQLTWNQNLLRPRNLLHHQYFQRYSQS